MHAVLVLAIFVGAGSCMVCLYANVFLKVPLQLIVLPHITESTSYNNYNVVIVYSGYYYKLKLFLNSDFKGL